MYELYSYGTESASDCPAHGGVFPSCHCRCFHKRSLNAADCRDAQFGRLYPPSKTCRFNCYSIYTIDVETPRFPGFQCDVETPNLGVYIHLARACRRLFVSCRSDCYSIYTIDCRDAQVSRFPMRRRDAQFGRLYSPSKACRRLFVSCRSNCYSIYTIDVETPRFPGFQYDVETPNLGVYIHLARACRRLFVSCRSDCYPPSKTCRLYIRLIVETPRFPGFQYDVETPNLGVYIHPARHAGLIVILYIRLT